jgi:fumarylacetoacetase
VPDGEGPPHLAPTRRLDFELEVGVVVGSSSLLGEPIPIDRVDEHLFGIVLLNDWSARDVQAFEYQPLGPFGAKSFATSISPWVTPLAALESYRVAPPAQEPEPDPYLRADRPWAFALELEVWLQRAGSTGAERVCRVDFSTMYWTMAQQLAHLTVNGASTRPGDLLGSGTVSGPGPGSEGSLLESGRDFLGDGDVVTLRGGAGRPTSAGSHPTRVELGEVTGEVVP